MNDNNETKTDTSGAGIDASTLTARGDLHVGSARAAPKRTKPPGLWERADKAAAWLLSAHNRSNAEIYVKVAAVLVMVDAVHALKSIARELHTLANARADVDIEVDAPDHDG